MAIKNIKITIAGILVGLAMVLAAVLALAQTAHSQIGGGIGGPTLWYLDGTTLRPVDPSWSIAVSGTPAGNDTEVQFNDGGSFAGDTGFTFNKSTDTLTLAGNLRAEDLLIEDSNASHYLTITTTTDLSAGHTLTLVPGDADRTITLQGNPTLADWFDQSVKTSVGVTFSTVDTGQGANELYDMDQNVLISSAPTFAGLTLTGTLLVDNAQELRLGEADVNGTNYIALVAPSAITSNATCTLEDDANPIPDSCVGDGSDGTGAPTDATYITQTSNGTLSAEQALASLSSGIMRVATTTGVITSLTDSAGIAANISDETGSGLLVFGTSPTFTTSITVNGGDPADAGVVRLTNAANIAWEASPAGTDETLTVSSGENFQFSGPIEVDASDPADAGAIRLDNAENISWEASPAGTDCDLGATSAEVLTSSCNLATTLDLTVTGGDIVLGTSSIFSGGDTAQLNNLDALDSTSETTIETAIDTLNNYSATSRAVDGATLLLITNSDADNAADSIVLDLAINDGADVNSIFLRGIGDADGTPATVLQFSETATTGALQMIFGATGVTISDDGDGALTIIGRSTGNDESLTINFDDTADTLVLSSASGVTAFDFGTIGADFDSATVTLSTVSGAVNAGGATSVEIPNGTGITIDTTGEIGVDTTDDQLRYQGASVSRNLTYKYQKSITIESPADADNFLIWKAPDAITITDIDCIVDPADTTESVVIDIQERDGTADNPATVDATITCDNDGAADDGSLTNGAIDANDWVGIDIGTVTGTVTQVSVTIIYTITTE